MKISYNTHDKVSAEEFISVVKRSGLNRPIENVELMKKMVTGANLIITARTENGELVGIARSVTDFAFCCYLSCLAVDKKYQGKNIGKRLIKETLLAIGEDSILLLLSAPTAETYYSEAIGMKRENQAFEIPRGEPQKAMLEKLELLGL